MSLVWDCQNLGGGYGEAEGRIEGINLQIHAGERVALIGRDGSGRKILLRLLAGLRPIRSGKLTVMEHELALLPYNADWDQIMPMSVRRRIGICLEVEGHLSNVSIREGLELLFRFKYGDHNKKLREAASKIVTSTCEKFGLGEAINKRPNLLSPSERRLAGLARAFLSKPHVVILENPSQAIGDSSRDRLWRAMEFIAKEEDRTLLLSTDDWSIAWAFCPRWIVLDKGAIVFDGRPADFVKTNHELVQKARELKRQRAYAEFLENELAEGKVA